MEALFAYFMSRDISTFDPDDVPPGIERINI
jgi:hypothetical protein